MKQRSLFIKRMIVFLVHNTSNPYMKTRFSSKTSKYSSTITLLKEIFQIEICSFLKFFIYS